MRREKKLCYLLALFGIVTLIFYAILESSLDETVKVLYQTHIRSLKDLGDFLCQYKTILLAILNPIGITFLTTAIIEFLRLRMSYKEKREELFMQLFWCRCCILGLPTEKDMKEKVHIQDSKFREKVYTIRYKTRLVQVINAVEKTYNNPAWKNIGKDSNQESALEEICGILWGILEWTDDAMELCDIMSLGNNISVKGVTLNPKQKLYEVDNAIKCYIDTFYFGVNVEKRKAFLENKWKDEVEKFRNS